mmetsp:Transcript_9600/g.11951  ORF Transcript_9600/g.11951 Transcript_9600/m.11951 type:complete len:174 (-) Transcript_9600:1217-1738(-)
MLYVVATATVGAVVGFFKRVFAPEKLYPYALVLASTVFCTFYLSMHFGPLFGKKWMAGMEEFRNKKADAIFKAGYPMKYSFASSYVGNLVRSVIAAIAFQMYSPKSFVAVVTFGLMDFLFLASHSHHFVWEGKPKTLIVIGLISTFITSMGSAFIYHLGALEETAPILIKCSA